MISKIVSKNPFTCKGTYMTDWVGQVCGHQRINCKQCDSSAIGTTHDPASYVVWSILSSHPLSTQRCMGLVLNTPGACATASSGRYCFSWRVRHMSTLLCRVIIVVCCASLADAPSPRKALAPYREQARALPRLVSCISKEKVPSRCPQACLKGWWPWSTFRCTIIRSPACRRACLMG